MLQTRGSRLKHWNAWFGLAFAAALAVIETIHNWGDWSEPAFWIIDYLACILLAGGAGLVLFRKQEQRGMALLGVGWGFACAMFWMAYFLIRQEFALKPETADPLVLYVCLGLFLATVAGLLASLVLILKAAD